jgi:hypothetical protein
MFNGTLMIKAIPRTGGSDTTLYPSVTLPMTRILLYTDKTPISVDTPPERLYLCVRECTYVEMKGQTDFQPVVITPNNTTPDGRIGTLRGQVQKK